MTDATFYAVEPNERARSCLVDDGVVPSSQVRASAASAIDFPDGVVDLAFTSGVLIHIPPEDLETSCREIYRCARRFIVCIEYFADKPETIAYRGKSELLFKRDFGAYWLEIFPSLTSMRWGFAWKQATGLDNLTWWLFRK